MITQYTKSNASDYNKLFEKASDALELDKVYVPVEVETQNEFMQSIIDGCKYFVREEQEDGTVVYTPVGEEPEYNSDIQYYIESGEIQTLEQYFCHLGDLLSKHNGYKYIMLPLDEPALEINANTREIKIPAAFKTAGLSVQGDELAETLFFTVNRFFDAMDLSTCEIYVQWNLPNGQTYATPIYMIDIESRVAEGEIIFGCPLTSEITQTAGTVEFSVRFLKRGSGDSIVYSLSTKPVKASIGAGLKFETMEYIAEDQIANLFAAAIENSDTASGEPAPVPVITDYLGDGGIGLTPVYLTGSTQQLDVVATVTHGDLSYEWYQTVEEGSWARKIYDGGNVYSIITGEEPVDIASEDYAEKTKTGIYQVRVINRLNNKTSKVWSDKVILPAPTAPELKTLEPNIVGTTLYADILNADGHAVPHYYWTRTDADNVTTIVGGDVSSYETTDDGYYSVKVGSTMNGDIAYTTSNSVRITNEPAAVEFTGEANKSNPEQALYTTLGHTTIDLSENVNAPAHGDFSSDSIEYHWYIDSDAQGVIKDLSGETPDKVIDKTKIEITYDISTPIISDLQAFDKDTAIRCVAINKLNGRYAYSESRLYRIDIPEV